MSTQHDDTASRLLRATDIAPNDLYDALSSHRRRIVLDVLGSQPLPVTTADLARAVAAREANVAPEDVSSAQVEAVEVSLYHSHLPRLADHGLVRNDDGVVSAVARPLRGVD